MKFLMLSSFYPPHHFGGDATYVRQLSHALAARGHDVRIVHCYDAYRVSGGSVSKDAETRDGPVSVRCLSSRFGPLSPLISQQTGRPGLKHHALADEFARQPEFGHFHNMSMICAPVALKMSQAPITLVTSHDHWMVCASHILWKNNRQACDRRQCFTCQIRSGKPPQMWRYTGLLQRSLPGVDQIFAPSQFTHDRLEQGGITRPIAVLPNFASRDFEQLAERQPPARPVFLYVGRITRSKGISELAALFCQRPEYDLQIAGNGDLLDSLKDQYRDASNISFLGHMPQSTLITRYRNATALVLPSIAPETFGLSTIEAYAQATPAIVRDAGGAGEPVHQAGGGIVYRTDTELLDALDRLASDDSLRARLSREARQSYEDHFREDRHVDTYLAHIERLTNAPAGTAGGTDT